MKFIQKLVLAAMAILLVTTVFAAQNERVAQQGNAPTDVTAGVGIALPPGLKAFLAYQRPLQSAPNWSLGPRLSYGDYMLMSAVEFAQVYTVGLTAQVKYYFTPKTDVSFDAGLSVIHVKIKNVLTKAWFNNWETDTGSAIGPTLGVGVAYYLTRYLGVGLHLSGSLYTRNRRTMVWPDLMADIQLRF